MAGRGLGVRTGVWELRCFTAIGVKNTFILSDLAQESLNYANRTLQIYGLIIFSFYFLKYFWKKSEFSLFLIEISLFFIDISYFLCFCVFWDA